MKHQGLLLFFICVGLSLGGITTIPTENTISKITSAAEGGMWLSYTNGVIEKRDLKGDIVVSYATDVTGIVGAPSAIYEAKDGSLHVGTNQGLYAFDGVNWSGYQYLKTPNEFVRVMSFAEDYDGELNAIVFFNGLWERNSAGEWRTNEHLFEGKNIWHQYVDHAGTHWVVGQDMVNYLNKESGNPVKMGMTNGLKAIESYYDITSTNDNTLCLASRYSGLILFKDEQVVKKINSSAGAKSDWMSSVTTVGEDIFFTYRSTALGLGHYKDGKVTHYTTEDGLFSNHIIDLATATDKTVWAISAEGISLITTETSLIKGSVLPVSKGLHIEGSTLSFDGGGTIASYEVYSVTGRLVRKITSVEGEEVILSKMNLSSGVYTICAQTKLGFKGSIKCMIQ